MDGSIGFDGSVGSDGSIGLDGSVGSDGSVGLDEPGISSFTIVQLFPSCETVDLNPSGTLISATVHS
ncbi:hypothetical protein [Mediterraneibacter glycyrrhizinilyticus]|uniref:hypothetical protein n=1 Tax=Mediterraneibacter glycyrrhizinilyticus TaxID=342942 RepID=UPI00189C5B81|nr:hypothetical protein [Mediterraneibacter glycyrrhizinilyticus]